MPPTTSALHLEPLTRAEIDLDALRHNARQLCAHARPAEVLGVVKADAYGHGAVAIARALETEGLRYLGVASVAEAVQLREAGVRLPILVFGAPLVDLLPTYVAYDLTVTISSVAVAEAVVEVGRRLAASGGTVRVHVKVDTGMHRLGLAPEEVPGTVARLQAAPGVEVEGLWTHFATADFESDNSYVLAQYERYLAVVDAVRPLPPLLHVANSGAFLRMEAWRDLHRQGHVLVRPGGLLYGVAPPWATEQIALRSVMRLVTRVVHVQNLAPGETVSYGRTWTAQRPSRIATLAIGYGDGYPRSLSSKGEVSIHGRRYRVAGRVTMDMTMIDLGAPDGPGASVQPGDAAVLWGGEGPTLTELAERAGTISYELCCGLKVRVPRIVMAG